MHMTTKLGPIPIIYYQLQPLKPLYLVTGPLGTQIFACKKSSAIPQLLPQLLSLFGCPNAYDNKVWSHTHHSLPIAANETPLCGHKKLRNTSFFTSKNLFSQGWSPFCLSCTVYIYRYKWCSTRYSLCQINLNLKIFSLLLEAWIPKLSQESII